MPPASHPRRKQRGGVLRRIAALLGLALALAAAPPALAEDVYKAPESFLEDAFEGAPPKPEALWLTGDTRAAAETIMNRKLNQLRMRYWRKTARTAWILEEVGKERPITAGFVVEAGKLKAVQVLIYRESRGWEIRYPYFRDQFLDARLTEERRLSRDIDNISGATLSVRAMRRMARLALFLHEQVVSKGRDE